MEIRTANQDALFKQWPEHWPSKDHYVSQHDVTREQFLGFKNLIENRASETEIERFLADNQEILALLIFLFSSGHHASWIYPKQNIRPSSGEAGGMIPDYVMAGANSDGVSWYILELKGANHNGFVSRGKRVYLSNEANKGICQLMNYIDASARSQGYLRDELRLNGYREPNGILLIGNGDEAENDQIQAFKGAWNRMNPRVQIVSYARLLRVVETKLDSKKANQGP